MINLSHLKGIEDKYGLYHIFLLISGHHTVVCFNKMGYSLIHSNTIPSSNYCIVHS
jgi:hypothetical protein